MSNEPRRLVFVLDAEEFGTLRHTVDVSREVAAKARSALGTFLTTSFTPETKTMVIGKATVCEEQVDISNSLFVKDGFSVIAIKVSLIRRINSQSPKVWLAAEMRRLGNSVVQVQTRGARPKRGRAVRR